MASPESSKPAPKSPIVQESPVFTYLSSLSPLKPVSSRPSTHPYTDTSCPVPEPVFTSPHFTRSSSMKRLTGGKRYICVRDDSAAPAFPESVVVVPSITQTVKLVPCVVKKCSGVGVPAEQSCGSPPTCVDAFLADPSENCDNESAEPAVDVRSEFVNSVEDQLICHERDIVHARPFTSDDAVKILTSSGLPDVNSDHSTVASVQACANMDPVSLNSSYLAEGEPAGDDSSVLPCIVETENNFTIADKAAGVDEKSRAAKLKLVSRDVGVSADSSIPPASSIQFEWNSFNQDHSSFMSKVLERPFCCQVAEDGKVHRIDTSQWGGPTYSPLQQSESLQSIQAAYIHNDVSGVISNTSAEDHSPFDQEDGAQHLCGMRKRLQFEAVEHCRSTGFSCKVDSVRHKESTPVTVPRTLGIGLHLNSIGGPMNINANMQLPENDPSVQGKDLLPGCNEQEQQSRKNCIATKSLTGLHSVQLTMTSDNFSPHSGSENSEEKQQENQATIASNSSYQSSLDVISQSSSLELKPSNRYITPCSRKKRPLEDACRTESIQRSPKKNKQLKKTENEGCKRCNCKRSKCLKLYCECFTAGIFCSDDCACQDCYNKPEHENKVHETRQLIESRNPLAFAPKVVVRATNAPKDTGDTERVTPASARHKRGCNCKKSLCLKKYCECFQAGVGCSLGCRCEGCKNSFGRKEGDEVIETPHEKNMEIGLERDPCGNLECREVKKQIISIENCYSRLTPLTPLFQGSIRNDATKSQLPAKYYPSPESGASVSQSYESPNSPMDSISSNAFPKESEGTSSVVPYNQESRRHTSMQADPFSPGWDRFPDICNFSPLQIPSPLGSSISASSKGRDPKTLNTKLFPGSGRLSVGTVCWRSSPVTPLPQLGEGKFMIEPDSDCGMNPNHGDDTPEILMDTCSPIKAVKASSPNQKRVSPPHKHLNEMRPSSSPATRSGRKFILQSVPSFPPLTPYSNDTRRHEM